MEENISYYTSQIKQLIMNPATVLQATKEYIHDKQNKVSRAATEFGREWLYTDYKQTTNPATMTSRQISEGYSDESLEYSQDTSSCDDTNDEQTRQVYLIPKAKMSCYIPKKEKSHCVQNSRTANVSEPIECDEQHDDEYAYCDALEDFDLPTPSVTGSSSNHQKPTRTDSIRVQEPDTPFADYLSFVPRTDSMSDEVSTTYP